MNVILGRTIQRFIERVSKGFPALLLTGPRQVGKTMLLESLKSPERKYVTLDNFEDRSLAKQDPRLFLQKYAPPVIIDEVQYAPELFPWIKIYVDSHRDEEGAFWLTGSQKFSLMRGIQESLAGRIAIIDMLGFSRKEALQRPFESEPFWPSLDMMHRQAEKLTAAEVFTVIWNGSFPRLLTNEYTERDVFYKEYLQTYIERDIRDDIGLSNELKYYDFIRAVAARTGCLLNYADLARDADINVKTASKWLETLARAGLVYLLEPYHPNITKRIVKTPKLYFLDTGLAAYLTKWDSPESLMNGAMNGAMLETFAFIEILKSFWHNGKQESIYFYRDTNQKEIDFILEKNMILYPVEIKKTSMPGKADVRHFGVLTQLKKQVGTGAIICLSPDFSPLPNENVIVVPIWEI
jgi:predicted AAA+ superfamily ATPase